MRQCRLHLRDALRDKGQCTCRYTIVKNGPRRLFVPNSAFLTREFMVSRLPLNREAAACLMARCFHGKFLLSLTVSWFRWWTTPPTRPSVIWALMRTLA